MKMKKITITLAALLFILAPTFGGQALAQETSQEELAKKLANPIAAMISIPFQLNYDQNIGPNDDGDRWTLNIQPVVPFDLNEDWNIISRTILPVINQSDIYPGAGSQSGIGDIVQSVFFSPKAPTASGWIWGAGPVFLLPTGSDDLLTADKWGAGPTFVALKQKGPWTYGGLMNHVWSFAGDDDRGDISSTFIQPFLSYTTPTAWTYALNTESTYDWKSENLSMPINTTVSKVTTVGALPISFTAGLRYWLDSPDSGPEGFGFRLVATFLLPR
jgi:hypothetical protein